MNTFLQLAAERMYSQKGEAENLFDPSYFVTALVRNTLLLLKLSQQFFTAITDKFIRIETYS